VLERLTGELCETLAREERRGRTIGIKVRFDDFSTVTRARSLDAAVNDRGPSERSPSSSCAPRIRRRRCGSWACEWRADEDAGLGMSDDQLSLSL
jgi:nucleotidyltransferase/DNA polymerase involved in DNA repair